MDASLEIKSLKKLPDSNLNLYRYVTLDKLLDFLLNKRIPLTRLDLFEDKLEGITHEHLSVNNLSKNIEENIAPWAGKLTEFFITLQM